MARSIAERSPNLVQVILALADDSTGSIDHQMALDAIAAIEDINDDLAAPMAERSN